MIIVSSIIGVRRCSELGAEGTERSETTQGGICRGHGGTYRSLNFEVWALNGLIIAHALQPLDVVPVADFTYK